jgi:ubiquinone/menaquinone biosynthesis C-methylase UbiE
LRFAAEVGPTGEVVGLDHDPEMVDEANRRAAEASVANAHHQTGDATRLPWPDASFDAVHSDRMLQHLDDPAAAVAEAHRVLRPGGRAVLTDTDWSTISMDCDDVEVERRLADHKRRLFQTGTAGRSLVRWMKQAGFVGVTAHPIALPATLDAARIAVRWDELVPSAVEAGEITAEEGARLEAELESHQANGWSFGIVTMITAVGHRA